MAEIFRLLREQLDFAYRLPWLVVAAGMPDVDPGVLALVSMLQASAGRYITTRQET